jgi:N-acetyl-beta-hexosaminidase
MVRHFHEVGHHRQCLKENTGRASGTLSQCHPAVPCSLLLSFVSRALLSVVTAAAIAVTSCLSPAVAGDVQGLPVIPAPTKCDFRDGVFVLTSQSRIVAADAQLVPLGKLLAGEIELLTSTRLTTVAGSPRPGDLVLAIDPALRGEEHSIDVGDVATVEAGNADAVALGTTTLLQAMTKRNARIEIPRMIVRDRPAVEYRGLMIDCARQRHSLATLKRMVVLCRWYKIRYVQLHLTDDESFTFPSMAYPQLATPGRHYSLADLRELEDLRVSEA